MKVIIAGSREIASRAVVDEAVRLSGFTDEISEVVSGGARGVDSIAFDWAWERGITVKRFLPDWSKHGRAAGPIRNREMAEYADALIAVWDGKSRGTANMIEEAERRGLKVYVHRVGLSAARSAKPSGIVGSLINTPEPLLFGKRRSE